MRWHRISPLHSEDVIPTARAFVRNGATDPEFIQSRLTQRGWDDASIFGVVREVERTIGKTSAPR
jgi:hypothetical protein